MSTRYGLNALNLAVFLGISSEVTTSQYCRVFCEYGCCGNSCCPDQRAIAVGSIFGGLAFIFLIVMLCIICMGYIKKKSRKERMQISHADQEAQTINKVNDTRTINMDSTTCTVIINLKNRKKAVVKVNSGRMSIIKEDDVDVQTRALNKPLTPQPLPPELLKSAEAARRKE
ncbi:uncharacterized protein LOC134697026 [Mytilus trossulus]|uniref:uncharacterized protein LOC134697026 n=1 Tax=Mytilus trossulus TaxID=6551 RepID=UPI003007DD62